MSNPADLTKFIYACGSCGAETSLDVIIQQIIDDDVARRAIFDVLTISLPLGGHVVRYLRLHKPARQRLRMDKARELLRELCADIARGAITRNGRDWPVDGDGWRAAFEVLFKRADKGTMDLPLTGNGYLYSIVQGMAESAEAKAEREREQALRAAPRTSTPPQTLAQALAPQAAPAAAPKPGTSPLVKKLRAEIEAKKRLREAQFEEGENDGSE